ncbi:hypothetical protein JXB01_04350 [Candidatus Micrarchaeota archaeon]|nr:hypothetical protein [Candidatus Micrarchaeota archaeon]
MVSITRKIRCSNCGAEAEFTLNTEMGIHEMTLMGKCPSCSNSMQINFNVVESSSQPKEEEQLISLDESVLTPEIPSDDISEIIDS